MVRSQVRFVDNTQQDSLLSYPVWPPEALSGWEFDAVVLADFEHTAGHRTTLGQCQVPDSKVIALTPVM
jgi:hypothetical protein